MILAFILGIAVTGGLIVITAVKASKLQDEGMWTERDEEFIDEDHERFKRAQLLSMGETIK